MPGIRGISRPAAARSCERGAVGADTRALRVSSWLGRGYESVPGRPFGWAFNRERQEIEAHLVARGWRREDLRFHFRVTAIQQRIHKYAPTFRQRQEAARERGEAWVAPAPVPRVDFLPEELERIAERFAMANDEIGIAIAAKARALLSPL